MKHKDALPKCDDCGRIFKTAEGLKIHSYKHVTERPHQCQLCSKSYLRMAHLKRHIKVTHGNQKSVSDGIFDHDDASFDDTTDDHLTSKTHQCPYCQNYYVKKKYLEKHLQAHHFHEQISQENDLIKTVEFCCDQCDISFSQQNQYEAHINSHKVAAPDKLMVKCNECDKVYMSRSAMLKHAKKHAKSNSLHKHGVLKTRLCPHCDRSFTDYILFLRHKSSHIRNPNRQCSRCHKAYTLKHVCVNKSEEPFFCLLCKTTFIAPKDFNEHLKSEHVIHRSQDNSFICKLCRKQFLQLKYFIRHFKCRHADCPTNKHKCELCGRSYSKRKYLTKHQLSHLTTPDGIDAVGAEGGGDIYTTDGMNGCQDDQEIYFEEDYGGIAFIPD